MVLLKALPWVLLETLMPMGVTVHRQVEVRFQRLVVVPTEAVEKLPAVCMVSAG
jgi:hypothetical protein